jgi:predicted SAM-dependent methyltransferase
MEKEKIKLHLGCRNDILEGYFNIDTDDIEFPAPLDEIKAQFVQMDVMDVDKHFPVGEIDEIVSRHLFEHLTHEQITILLLKLWRLLKPRGVLEITVPNFYHLYDTYQEQFLKGDFSNLDVLHSRFFGIEEEGFHKTIWNKAIGTFYLTREGFFEDPIVLYGDNVNEITFKTKKK